MAGKKQQRRFFNMKSSKRIQPRPFSVYFTPVLLLALAGFFDSVYLSVSHYRVHTDISYKSFCAVSRAINCDTVSQSTYAVFLGVPVPIWGVIGYFFLTVLVLFAGSDAGREKRGWTLLMTVSAVFSLYSVILALISNYLIHSYCIMCIVSYIINFALLFLCWLTRRRFSADSFGWGFFRDILFVLGARHRLYILGSIAATVPVLFFWFPVYWDVQAVELRYDIPRGITEGHPWIGAAAPELTIVEYSDYMCFQCRKMHFYLRELIQAHPDKIRLIHKHFPMDARFNPVVEEQFHGGAGNMSLLAIYALGQGKFWETNDVLFKIAKADFNVKTIARKTGLPAAGLAWALKSKEVRSLLNRDIRRGIKLGITGTPVYVINGQIHESIIPPGLINQVID